MKLLVGRKLGSEFVFVCDLCVRNDFVSRLVHAIMDINTNR